MIAMLLAEKRVMQCQAIAMASLPTVAQQKATKLPPQHCGTPLL